MGRHVAPQPVWRQDRNPSLALRLRNVRTHRSSICAQVARTGLHEPPSARQRCLYPSPTGLSELSTQAKARETVRSVHQVHPCPSRLPSGEYLHVPRDQHRVCVRRTWMTSHMPDRAISLHSASCCWRVGTGGRAAELLCDRRPGVDREPAPCHWGRPARGLNLRGHHGQAAALHAYRARLRESGLHRDREAKARAPLRRSDVHCNISEPAYCGESKLPAIRKRDNAQVIMRTVG